MGASNVLGRCRSGSNTSGTERQAGSRPETPSGVAHQRDLPLMPDGSIPKMDLSIRIGTQHSSYTPGTGRTGAQFGYTIANYRSSNRHCLPGSPRIPPKTNNTDGTGRHLRNTLSRIHMRRNCHLSRSDLRMTHTTRRSHRPRTFCPYSRECTGRCGFRDGRSSPENNRYRCNIPRRGIARRRRSSRLDSTIPRHSRFHNNRRCRSTARRPDNNRDRIWPCPPGRHNRRCRGSARLGTEPVSESDWGGGPPRRFAGSRRRPTRRDRADPATPAVGYWRPPDHAQRHRTVGRPKSSSWSMVRCCRARLRDASNKRPESRSERGPIAAASRGNGFAWFLPERYAFSRNLMA